MDPERSGVSSRSVPVQRDEPTSEICFGKIGFLAFYSNGSEDIRRVPGSHSSDVKPHTPKYLSAAATTTTIFCDLRSIPAVQLITIAINVLSGDVPPFQVVGLR